MRTFGLLGRSLAHSFSQAYFTQKFSELQLADYHYELFELATIAELPQLLARQPHLAGLLPHPGSAFGSAGGGS